MNDSQIVSTVRLIAICCFFSLVNRIVSFNIDTAHPLVYEDPMIDHSQRKSYFGYSIQFLFNQPGNANNSVKWILVAAPRANSTSAEHDKLIEPGRMYRCLLGNPMLDNCQQILIEKEAEQISSESESRYFEERKSFSWLGVSMAVNNPLSGRFAVCGHRWVNKINHRMNGMCYWSRHKVPEHENFNKKLPLISHDLQTTNNEIYNYAYGQAGISVHMVTIQGQEEMIIGAPGVKSWTGTVIRYRDKVLSPASIILSRRRKRRQASSNVLQFGDMSVIVENVTGVNQLKPSDYFGYTVHSGKFFSDGRLSYIAGAPRAADLKGKILIFDFVPESNSRMLVRQSKEGEQLGEYFGASIASVDLNRDSFDELLVGAPQHSIQPELSSKSGDEGKVYVYLNRNGVLRESMSLYGRKARGARFGSTILSIGDLNRDGFNDVAIGAPYEDENKGAVYIYFGGKDGGFFPHPENVYWQRIGASDFTAGPLSQLKGFGISLTAADVDDNQYIDLAVGSYLSSHALVFRSRPVLHFGLTIAPDRQKRINPNGDTFHLKACSQFRSESFISNICAVHMLYFDLNHLNKPRLILSENGDGKTYTQQPFKYTQKLDSDRPFCSTFTLTVANFTLFQKDFSPAKFKLEAQLLDDKCLIPTNGKGGSNPIFINNNNIKKRVVDNFCSDCPILNTLEKNFVENSINFDSDCGEDDVCMEHLTVNAHFTTQNQEFVIGSQKSLSFQVDIRNDGENAYMTQLELRLPENTFLIPLMEMCQTPVVDTDGGLKYICHLRLNPLMEKQSVTMNFELDVTSLQSGDSDSLVVFIEARIGNTENSDTTSAVGNQTRFNLVMPLKTAIDIEVSGNPVQEQLTYHRPNGTEIEKERAMFQHIYEIRNLLPSSAVVGIAILLPINALTTHLGNSITFLEFNSAQVSQKGYPGIINCSLAMKNKKSNGNLTIKIQSFLPIYKYPLTNRTAVIDCFDDKNISCARITCPSGRLSKDTPITITLTATLFLNSILDYFIAKKDIFIISSTAFVDILEPSNAQQPSNQKPDVAAATSYFLPQGPPAALAVAGWIIFLAILAGLTLLVLVSYILFKVGFFNRLKIPQDVQSTNPSYLRNSETEPEIEELIDLTLPEHSDDMQTL